MALEKRQSTDGGWYTRGMRIESEYIDNFSSISLLFVLSS